MIEVVSVRQKGSLYVGSNLFEGSTFAWIVVFLVLDLVPGFLLVIRFEGIVSTLPGFLSF